MRQLSERQRFRLEKQIELVGTKHGQAGPFSVLDLGTEYGHTGRTIKAAFPKAEVYGVEIHEETLNRCRVENPKVYAATHLGDALDFLKGADDYSYDVGVAAELIEHLEHDKGEELLDLLPRVCRFAIVTSPLGFMAQGDLYGNPHQVHVSGWTKNDLTDRGWTCVGAWTHLRLGIYTRAH